MRTISYAFRDADGDQTTEVIHVPDGSATLTELETFGQMSADLLDAVSDASIDRITLTVSIPLSGNGKVSPVANSEVQKGGLMGFSVNGSNYRHSLRIPAFTPALFSGNSINTGDTDVAAFITAMQTGVDVGGKILVPCDKYENDIVSLISARKSFRRK